MAGDMTTDVGGKSTGFGVVSILIEVPAEAAKELQQALNEAAIRTSDYATQSPTRMDDPDTPRYNWRRVAREFQRTANSIHIRTSQ